MELWVISCFLPFEMYLLYLDFNMVIDKISDLVIMLPHCRYPYLAVVLNFSQTWALYCLVQFYNVIKDKLAPIKPLAKFLTFKSIVFLTWWQGIIVAFLFSMGLVKGSLAKELKTRIQDYIICIEVVFIKLIVPFKYPYSDWCESINLKCYVFTDGYCCCCPSLCVSSSALQAWRKMCS